MDKNYDGAIRLLNQALKQEELSDYKSFIYRIRSMLFLDNKQYPEALSDAQNVTETTPEDLECWRESREVNQGMSSKSELNSFCQRNKFPPATYNTTQRKQGFKSSVIILVNNLSGEKKPTKKAAEESAAKIALDEISKRGAETFKEDNLINKPSEKADVVNPQAKNLLNIFCAQYKLPPPSYNTSSQVFFSFISSWYKL